MIHGLEQNKIESNPTELSSVYFRKNTHINSQILVNITRINNIKI